MICVRSPFPVLLGLPESGGIAAGSSWREERSHLLCETRKILKHTNSHVQQLARANHPENAVDVLKNVLEHLGLLGWWRLWTQEEP
eukprot:7707538-Pyramimonas_sp.AAC.1